MSSLEPDDLLRHGRRLRELARGLVRCEHDADDVVQDAFLRAVEQPPRHPGKVGSWLSVVVRNRARKRGLERVRRTRRERAVARSEAIDDETAARFALCRRIVTTLGGTIDAACRDGRFTVTLSMPGA